MPYKHILAAIDLSEDSNQVLDKARDAADNDGARLSLITVVKPLSHVYGGLDVAPLTKGTVIFEEDALEQVAMQLKAIAKIYRVEEADIHAQLGAPAHEIKDAANKLETDLIVMGTHNRHGLGRLLGSTANGVLHGAQCDVMAIRVTTTAE